MRSENDAYTLCTAAAISHRTDGNLAAAKLCTEIIVNSLERATKIMNSWKNFQNVPTKYSPEEALSLLVNDNLTKKQYISIYRGAKDYNINLYPSYNQLLTAKDAAYPSEISIGEKVCQISLQSLLNHTCLRLLQVIQLANTNSVTDCLLLCKYGFDGSSGHSSYKQSWSESAVDDQNLFLTSIVPMQLKDVNTNKVLWNNPRSSSTRFCRPVRLQWIKESIDIIKEEEKYMKEQISSLESFNFNNYNVHFSIHLTMVDGKVRKMMLLQIFLKFNNYL